MDGVKMRFDIDDYQKYLPQFMQSSFWEWASDNGMYSCSNLMINTIFGRKLTAI